MDNNIIQGTLVYTEYYDIAYLFNNYGYLGDTSLNLPVQITNNYVENNVAVQDHIAKPPITLTLSGLVGELVYKSTTFTLDKLKEQFKLKFGFEPKLGPITALFPSVGNLTQLAINTTQYVESSVKRYVNIYNQFSHWGQGSTVQITNQEKVYQELANLRDLNSFVNIITPWGTFEKYAITNIILRQSKDTNTTSDLEVSFQEWREIGTKMTKVDTSKYEERCGVQNTVEANHGKAQGKDSLESTSYKILNGDAWGIAPVQFRL